MKTFMLLASIVCCLGTTQVSEAETYHKSFYENDQLKAEGWMMYEMKVNYWYFYNPDGSLKAKGDFKADKKHGYWYVYDTFGNLKSQGHYKASQKTAWWIRYEAEMMVKTQYSNNKKQGYSFWYKNDKLFKAERFKNAKKEGEWMSISAFKRDNPNAKF